MRTFKDSADQPWQAALLDASMGSIRLVFSPVHGTDLRQQPLAVENMADALRHLETMDDDALRALLESAAAWDPASGG